MASGGALELKVEKLVSGGDGLAFHEGRAVFVPLALPGERVRVQIRESRKDYARASLLEVLEPSPGRIAPACGLYGECGGCDLQHLAYPEQVKAKAGLVAESFKRVGKLEIPEPAVFPSIPFAYRNRVQFHLTPAGRLGFMRASSSSIIEAPTCPVAVRSLQAWIESRAGTGRGLEDLRPFIVGKDRFIAFGTGDKVFLEGRDGIVQVKVAGENFRFHIKGFFQSNLYLLEHFIPEVMDGLGTSGSGLAADLYCGVGLFSRFLAKRFSRVVCVEHNPYALDLARENAPGAGNEYHALSTEDWTRTDSARQDFDCVLVDPPRTGLTPEVKTWFSASRPPVIVYVSCDPVTLARDSGELCAAGYRLETLKVYDFYPQTHHIECHARFRLD